MALAASIRACFLLKLAASAVEKEACQADPRSLADEFVGTDSCKILLQSKRMQSRSGTVPEEEREGDEVFDGDGATQEDVHGSLPHSGPQSALHTSLQDRGAASLVIQTSASAIPRDDASVENEGAGDAASPQASHRVGGGSPRTERTDEKAHRVVNSFGGGMHRIEGNDERVHRVVSTSRNGGEDTAPPQDPSGSRNGSFKTGSVPNASGVTSLFEVRSKLKIAARARLLISRAYVACSEAAQAARNSNGVVVGVALCGSVFIIGVAMTFAITRLDEPRQEPSVVPSNPQPPARPRSRGALIPPSKESLLAQSPLRFVSNDGRAQSPQTFRSERPSLPPTPGRLPPTPGRPPVTPGRHTETTQLPLAHPVREQQQPQQQGDTLAVVAEAESPAGNYLCEELVVPYDNECLLIIPRHPVLSKGSFNIVDAGGSEVLRVAVRGATASTIGQGAPSFSRGGSSVRRLLLMSSTDDVLAQSCQVRSTSVPGAQEEVTQFQLLYSSGDYFATLKRAAPFGAYDLRTVTGQKLTFDGKKEEFAWTVVDGDARVVATAEPCRVSFDVAPTPGSRSGYFRLRLTQLTDVGIVLSSILSIYHLSGIDL